MCFETACLVIANGLARSLTLAGPRLRRAMIALRTGSARARNARFNCDWSMVHLVDEVSDTSAGMDLRILEKDHLVELTKPADASAEEDRNEVHPDLIDNVTTQALLHHVGPGDPDLSARGQVGRSVEGRVEVFDELERRWLAVSAGRRPLRRGLPMRQHHCR